MSEEYPQCSILLRERRQPYPPTCQECGLGPCKRKAKQENTMSELKPFDLERAKAGDFFCEDDGSGKYNFLSVLPDETIAFYYTHNNGSCGVLHALPSNLRMLPRKVKRWHVIVETDGYESREDAEREFRVVRDLRPGFQIELMEKEWSRP